MESLKIYIFFFEKISSELSGACIIRYYNILYEKNTIYNNNIQYHFKSKHRLKVYMQTQ